MNTVSWAMILILAGVGVAGLCMARKIRNGDSFYVMEEKAPSFFLVCGICMSYISAVTMSSGPGICYENGPFLLLTTAQPGAWMGTLVAILFIGRKMKAVGCYTVPDYFSKRFSNNNVTCLALLIMVVVMEIYGSSQMVAIGTALSEATGLSYEWIIVIFTLSILLFCVPGGTWSVMMTDTLMFVAVLVTAFVVCPVIIHEIYPEAVQNLPASFWSVRGVNQMPIEYGISQTVLWFTFFAASPVIITRVFPAKDDFSVFKAAVISVVLIALISCIVYFTAGLMQGVAPGIPSGDQVMLEAFNRYAPPALGLIGMAGILTAAVSTASVLFCLVGFSISRDLYGLLNPDRIEDINSVRRGRITQVFAVGIGGAIAYLQPSSSFDLSIFACGIFAASWLPTILMSLLWKRYSAAAAFYGMISGAAALTVLQGMISFRGAALPHDMDQYLISMLVSVVVSVVLTVCMPTDCGGVRRHYQIRNAQLSDQIIREFRTRPDVIARLCRGYRQTRRVMIGVAVSAGVVLTVMCVVFYRLVIP